MQPFSFDIAFEQFVVAHRTILFNDVFLWLTQLGDPRVIAVVVVSMAIVLFRHKRLSYALAFAVVLAGALASSYVLQNMVERARPPLVYHLINVTGYSFPSIHATVSTATYGFLCYMTWKLMRPPHHRAPWIGALVALIVLICFSRVYLGVHYASDVVAGALLGIVWIWIGAKIAQRYAKSNFKRAMRTKTP